MDDEAAREEAKAKGVDYDRERMLTMPADVAEKLGRKKRKKNPDQGFSDFEQAAIRWVGSNFKDRDYNFHILGNTIRWFRTIKWIWKLITTRKKS